MAISATFELRESGSAASAVYGFLFKSYTVVDLDYTLKRSIDKTGRPSSKASLDFIKVTIRGTKEMTAKFHEWIKTDDKLMDGVIKIFDSTGYATALTQDLTGGETTEYLEIGSDLLRDEIEENLNNKMDEESHYTPAADDIFEEMDRSELLSYIETKQLNIKVDDNDSVETIKGKIRYYKKIHNMTKDELLEEAKSRDSNIKNTATKEECLAALEKYNNSTKAKLEDNVAKKRVETLKKSTTKNVSSAANTIVKGVLESARSITFKNAYCISLREHFKGDPNNQGNLDASYPWLIEIGIKPGILEVTGANVAGQAAPIAVETFQFF